MKIKNSRRQQAKSVKKPISAAKVSNSHRVKQKKVLAKKQIHQNRPFYKKLLLHPFSVFLILCMVVFVSDWTFRVIADSYTVTAVVLAPLLSEGATITSLTNNEIVTSAPITISGTCPTNSYVNLYINNLYTGTDFCTNQIFTIQADLFAGLNTLVARDFNTIDQQGPATPALNVSLSIPSITTSGNTLSSRTQPLVLVSNYYYQTFTTNNTYTWQLSISGGKVPYKVNISWGDGSKSNLVFNTDPSFTISHKYAKPGYYTILVTASDAAHDSQTMQLAALIKLPGSSSLLSTTPKAGPTSISYKVNNFFESSKVWLWAAWSSIIVVCLMLVSFLLGEHEQRIELLKSRSFKTAR